MKKNLLLLSLIGLGLYLGFYSKDLGQRNPETEFLTSSGIKEYEAFKDLVPERKVVIFKFLIKEGLKKERFDKWQKNLAPLLQKYEGDFDFLRPEDLYTSSKKLYANIERGSYTKKQINLIGEKFLAFIAIEKKSDTDFHRLIDEVRAHNIYPLELAGIPFTNYLLDNYSRSIKEKVFPVMFAVSFIFILLICRNILASIFIFLPCLFSAVICLSFIKYFYGTMNMVTSIIPLMCFTITLAVVFHLFFSIRNTNSFKLALKKKFPPIFLMILTTCIGFGSLMISDIQAISDFGKLSLFLILITCIYSILFLAASERFLINDKKHQKSFNAYQKYFHTSFNYKVIAIFSILSISIGGYLLNKIDIITDATEYFPKDSGLKESIDSVNKSIAGIPLYEIIIEDKEASLGQLERFDRLEKELYSKVQKIEGYNNILSLGSLIKSANAEYSGQATIPDQELAFLTLRSRIKPAILDSFPYSKNYKIAIMGKAINVKAYQEGLFIIDNFLKKQKVSYKINGLYYNLMLSQKSMISVLFKSFLIALIIVSTIALIYLKEGRIFFIFLFVNIIPVFTSFIFMYLFSFSINIATVMTYSIALGMIVDSSFHLIHSLKERAEIDFSEYYSTTVLPIIGSSVLLIGSFSLFGLNGFLPIKEFGLNLSIILFLGLIFDLFILPTLFLGSAQTKEAFNVSNL